MVHLFDLDSDLQWDYVLVVYLIVIAFAVDMDSVVDIVQNSIVCSAVHQLMGE